MSKKGTFYLIILVQILFLLAMVGTKVYTLKAGKKVLLEVVPVDPRSLFRGEYARLNYKISTIQIPQIEKFKKNQIVYVTLKKSGKFWEVFEIYDKKPRIEEGEVLIIGKKTHRKRVEYGIESYFLPEGQAIIVERIRRPAEVTVEVSIDSFGNSTISKVFIDDKTVEEYLKDQDSRKK